MEQNSLRFQTRVFGMERKEVARLIASHFETQVIYEGAPGFGYLVKEPGGREWRIDKTGTVITDWMRENDLAQMLTVLKTLEDNGLEAVGQAEVTIPTEGHNGVTLRNLINIIVAKEKLIAKATGIENQPLITPAMAAAVNSARLKTADDFLDAAGKASPGIKITKESITFRWFAPTLTPEVIMAYIQLAVAINKIALAQKHSSPRETETANEKYTFRVWLLRLGFIGESYGPSRKLFLDRLSGDGSFRTPEQAAEAVRKRKKKCA